MTRLERLAADLETAIAGNGKDIRTMQRLAEVYVLLGEPDLAVNLTLRIAHSFEDDGFAAVAVLKRTLSDGVDRVEVHEHLARLCGRLGLDREAADHQQLAARTRSFI